MSNKVKDCSSKGPDLYDFIRDLRIKELRQDSENIKKILEFKLLLNRMPTRLEIIKNLGLTINELERALNIMKKEISYSEDEKPRLKKESEKIIRSKVIKKNFDFNLFNILTNFEYLDVILIKKISKFLIDSCYLKNFPDIPRHHEDERSVDSKHNMISKFSSRPVKKSLRMLNKKMDKLIYLLDKRLDSEWEKIKKDWKNLKKGKISNWIFLKRTLKRCGKVLLGLLCNNLFFWR